MFADPRRIAVAFCAIGAFLNLYGPQAVLPMMAREYGVGAADASLIITAGTLAVAATAPFTGALSDVIGRKRLIVVALALLLIPAAMTALAPSLNQIIFWRFVHGLLLPPIFAVTIAYIGDEFPPNEANSVFGIYAAASAVGGTTPRATSRRMHSAMSRRARLTCLRNASGESGRPARSEAILACSGESASANSV